MWPGPHGEWGSRRYLLASLDQSLQRIGLEYVDIFELPMVGGGRDIVPPKPFRRAVRF